MLCAIAIKFMFGMVRCMELKIMWFIFITDAN